MTNAKKSQLSKDYSTTVTILEHLSDALFILNAQGKVEYANRVALDMLNIDLQSILGTFFNSYLNAEFNTDMLYDSEKPELLLENIYRGVFSEIETALIHNEYSTPVIISFGLVRDAAENISFIIASAKDITIRKALEKELQQQQLMTLSRDRYRELGELAVNMVHNLSQPITSVRLMMELMEKQVNAGNIDSEKFKRYFKETTQLLDGMTGSISQVRNFAFLTEDETMKPVFMPDVVQSVLKQLEYEINERDIQISVQSEEKLPPVIANPISLQQAFNTLLRYFWSEIDGSSSENAKKKITFKVQNIKNRWLRISLSNLKSEQQQLKDESAEIPLIGSQLDLTVVQIILTSLGGDFHIRSYPDSQYEFILRIPVDKGAERDQLRNMIELLHQ